MPKQTNAPLDRLEMLQNIADAANQLERYLSENSGSTADWPIGIIARCGESQSEISTLLNNLSKSLKPYREHR